jgi:hypothetical protein
MFQLPEGRLRLGPDDWLAALPYEWRRQETQQTDPAQDQKQPI